MGPDGAAGSMAGTAWRPEEVDPVGLRVFLLLAATLAAGAALRTADNTLDFGVYQQWYRDDTPLWQYIASPAMILEKDPGYFLLTSAFNRLGVPFRLFAFLFSSFWIAVKSRQMLRMSNAPFVSLLVYASFLYPLQDLIQMRAGAAAGMFLLALPFLVQGNRIAYVGLCLIGATFHYSAFALLPLVLLGKEAWRPRWYLYALLASVAVGLAGIRLDPLVQLLDELGVGGRIAFYAIEVADEMAPATILNRVSLPTLALAIVLLLEFDRVKAVTPYASLVVRVFALSQIVYFLLVPGLSAFAFRLSELLGIVGFLAWPLLLVLVEDRKAQLALYGAVCLNFLAATIRVFP